MYGGDTMALPPSKDRIVIVVSKDSKSKLEKLAKNDSRSLSNYCNLVLEQHINSSNIPLPTLDELLDQVENESKDKD